MDMTNLMSKLSAAEKIPLAQSKLVDIESFEIIQATDILPMTVSKVDDCSENFRTLPQAVRSAYPNMLVKIMKLYVRLSNTTPDEKIRLKEAANALVMFSGR